MIDFSKPAGEADAKNRPWAIQRWWWSLYTWNHRRDDGWSFFGQFAAGFAAIYGALALYGPDVVGNSGGGLFANFLVGTLEAFTLTDFTFDPSYRGLEAIRAEVLMLPAGIVGAIAAGMHSATLTVRPYGRSAVVAVKYFLAFALPFVALNAWGRYELGDNRLPHWFLMFGGTFFGLVAACFAARLRVPFLRYNQSGLLRGSRVRDFIARKPRKYDAVAEGARTGQIAFAGELLPREAEVKHIVALGTTGTGKSTAGYTLIRTAVDRGDRMVIADPGGDALSRFWKPDDVILNPFDGRSVKWDMFAEIEEWTDYDRLAEALLPLSGSAEGDEWVGEGRTLLSCLIRSYHGLGAGTTDDFAKVLLTGGNELWAELCEGTEAAVLFEDGNERMRGSVVNKLKPATKLLNAIADSNGRPFSIRQWVREGRGRMWLPYRLNQLATLRGAIGTWMSVAILETLSLPEDRERRVWFVADELDVLGTVPDLDKGLTNGRRFGACFVLGFQSIAQLEKNYGRFLSRTIIENCSTKLILRCEVSEQGGTADFASTLIGDREVMREEHSSSSSTSAGGAGGGTSSSSSSISYRQATERAIMTSQITQLPDRTGFLRIGGQDLWQKVEFPFNTFEAVTDAVKPAGLQAANRNRVRFTDAAE